MAQITIDGKDYDSDNLSEEATKMFNNLRFVQNEITRYKSLIAVNETASQVYGAALKKELENTD
tara:strand:+ start:4950 stop:5141 length:192 start_codon:yes stop_codon:yes gene_type:complete